MKKLYYFRFNYSLTKSNNQNYFIHSLFLSRTLDIVIKYKNNSTTYNMQYYSGDYLYL